MQLRDRQLGSFSGAVDDFVLCRGDSTPSYNLVVVIDDAEMGITEVVRGDDLLPTTPRQVYLSALLGIPSPIYAHVPLVLNESGNRLAKRDGAVTLDAGARESELDVLNYLLSSLAIPRINRFRSHTGSPDFEPSNLPTSHGCSIRAGISYFRVHQQFLRVPRVIQVIKCLSDPSDQPGR